MDFLMIKSGKFFAGIFLFLVSFQLAQAQVPTSTISNKKDACDGIFNGSFDISVNAPGTTGPYTAFVFGLGFSQVGSGSANNTGEIMPITGLRPDTYLVVISDSDPVTANYSTFVTINAVSAPVVAFAGGSPQDNSNCNSPNGQIRINVSGGSGTGFTYSWTASNGFTATTEDINGLAGGDYTVIVTDNGSVCTTTFGPVTINDPSPIVYDVSTTTPVICDGSTGNVTLSDSESAAVTYEIYKDGSPTGITLVGTGAALAFVIPASELVAPGNYAFTIRAVRGLCTPAFMNGTANIQVNPNLTPSVSISANPGTTICAGTSVTFTALPTNGGAAPIYQWKKNGGNVGAGGTTYTDAGLLNGDLITVEMTSNETCLTTPIATSNQLTMIVNPNLTPAVSISANPGNTICDGTSVTFTAVPTNGGAGPVYQWKKNGGNVGTGGTTYTDAALVNGDVIEVEMTSNEVCLTTPTAISNQITMVVNPNLTPSVSISANPGTTICDGTSVTFTAVPTNGGAGPVYQWKKNGGNVGTGGTTYTDAALVNGDIIEVELTSNETCLTTPTATSNQLTMTVTPTVTPSVTISANPGNIICATTSVTFTAVPTNGGAGPVYQWKKNGGNVGTGGTTYTDAALANGDVITVEMTSNEVCPVPAIVTSNTITMTVNANVTPSVTISANPGNVICATTSVTFTAVPTNGGAAPVYQWKKNGGNVGTGGTTYTDAALANGDVITVEMTSNEVCPVPATVTSNTITMTVSTAPDAGTDNSVTACNTDAAFDLFASLGGTPDNGGSWTDLDASGAVITGNNVDLTTLTIGPYRYQYTITGTAPCVDASAIVTVNVINATPDAGSANTVSACNSDTAFDLFASLGGTPDPGGSWSDLDASGAVITGNNVDLNTLVAGAYRYQYDITVAGCGSASAIVTVNVTLPPDAGTANAVSACDTESSFDLFASLGGTPDNGGSWTDLDGSGAVITVNAADFTGVAPGTYRFEYTVTGTAPCADATAIVTIDVVASPDAGIANAVSACNTDGAFDLFASLGGTPDNGGLWTDLDGSGAVITGNAADFTSVAAGVFRFGYTVTGTAPCVDASAIVTVTIVGAPDAGTDNSVTACNTDAAFDLRASLGGTPDPVGTWTDLDASGALITGDNIDLTSLAVGTYRYEYRVTGTAPCADATAIVTVNVINTTPDAGGPNTVSACNSDTAFDLFASLSGTPDSGGSWTDMDGSGAVITGNNINLNGVAAGSYDYQYDITVAGCGSSSAIVTVNVQAVDATIAAAGPFCVTDGPVTLTAATSGGTWSGTGITNAATGTFDPATAGVGSHIITYSITVGLCTDTKTRTIQVSSCVGGDCATVVITPQPTPATCTLSNGSIHFDINPPIPAINITGVKIDIVGPVSRTNFNDPDFAGLPAGVYNYTIEYGDPGCIKTGTVTIDKSGTVGTPLVSNPVSPVCFGSFTGSVTIDVAGETGNPLQWSLTPADASSWTDFTAGQPGGVQGLPAGDLIVSIRRTSSDPCYAAAFVTITESTTQITAAFSVTDATCGNSDGVITITTAPAGGTGGPYTFEVDGALTVPVSNAFSNLAGGNHTVTVIDNSGCERDFVIYVPFPDAIQVDAVSSSDGGCGTLGSITILIKDFIPSAQYEVGVSNSLIEEPAEYFPQYYVGGGLVVIPDLARGNYFVWLRTGSGQCPTVANYYLLNAPIVIGGSYPISFEFGCREIDGDLTLTNVNGAPGSFDYEVTGNGFTSSGTFTPDLLGTASIVGFSSGAYSVRLSQDQSLVGGCNSETTLFFDAPLAALDTVFIKVPNPTDKYELSLPEAGTAARIVRIQESGMGPYEVMLKADPLDDDNWIVVDNREVRFDNLFAGDYTLSLKDGYGCLRTYSLTIGVDESIYIPNIFTPDNNGKNDSFFIRNLPDGSKLIVNDRWGKQVYSSNNYKSYFTVEGSQTEPIGDWRGEGAEDGVYYYRLQVEGGKVYTGWVEILRGPK